MKGSHYVPTFAELPTYRWRMAVLWGLIEMRRAGEFRAVWCDDWKIRIQHEYGGILCRVPWGVAAGIVEDFRSRKGTK